MRTNGLVAFLLYVLRIYAAVQLDSFFLYFVVVVLLLLPLHSCASRPIKLFHNDFLEFTIRVYAFVCEFCIYCFYFVLFGFIHSSVDFHMHFIVIYLNDVCAVWCTHSDDCEESKQPTNQPCVVATINRKNLRHKIEYLKNHFFKS